jgi:type VI secretion system secreted protein VgrG
MTITENKRFEFVSKAFDARKFEVVAMEGFESISRPFRFTLTLASNDAAIDFDTMLRSAATFTILSPDGKDSSPYHGVLAEFDQLHRTDGYVFYRAVLVPRLWHLSHFHASEAYTNEQTIPVTLEAVLKSANLTSIDYQMKLTGSYRTRSFVCQHQETHLDFLSRWMEKEGMYYHFDHSGATEKLIVVDDKIMHDAQVVKVAYRPVDKLENSNTADAVQGFVCRQKPLPHQVILQEYNHRKADLTLDVKATVSGAGIGDVILYGENYRDLAEGSRYAKLRAEEILCKGKVFFGEATATGMRSGYFMEMASHYRDDFNGKYLITEIHHQGSQAGGLVNSVNAFHSDNAPEGQLIYRNSFRAIAAAVQFRPERVTAKPRIPGTINAKIDAEGSGDVAELDEYGQYRVKLPFGSDKAPNKGSARIRMATLSAGGDHGMHFPLHKGAEVLLSFVNGDPDQPVIMNAIPNSESPTVVNNQNPEISQLRTEGGNVIALDDVPGDENILLSTPSLRGTVSIGGKEGNVFFSGNKSSTLGTLGCYKYSGLEGDSSISLGGRTAFGNMTDLTSSSRSLFRHGQGGDTTWVGGNKTLQTLSGYRTDVTKRARTSASDSIHLSAGYDTSDVTSVTARAYIKTVLNIAWTYLTAVKVAKTLPGLVATTRAAASGTTLVPVLNTMKTKESFDLDLYRNLSYAGNAGILAGTILNAIFNKGFKRYDDVRYVANMHLTNDGITFDYKSGIADQATMGLSARGFSHNFSHNVGAGTVTGSQYCGPDEAGTSIATSGITATHASLRLSAGGDASLACKNSMNLLSDDTIVLRSEGGTVNLKKNLVEVQAQNVNIGFSVLNPLANDLNTQIEGLLLKKRSLEGTIAELTAQLQPEEPPSAEAADELAEEIEDAMAVAAQNLRLRGEIAVPTAELVALEISIEAAQQAAAAAAAIPNPIMHGFSVSSSAVQMSIGSAGVKATPMQLALSLGTSGLNFGLGGLSLTDDKLIKIG